jgi:haloacetate dehalogenase
MIETLGNPVEIWKEYCEAGVNVSGQPLDCGHYIPEAKPEELLEIVLEAFA